MTIFADASALVAIIAGEREAASLEAKLEADRDRLCSTTSLWETVAALCRSYNFPVGAARFQVTLFSDEMSLRLVPVGAYEAELALDAYARFGKGRHKAALNMGDCFAYACAAANDAALLFKGEDFGLTDILAA